MNIITRYKWPVIVAAGLHGALFVGFSPDRVPDVSTKKDKPAVRPGDPPLQIDTREPEEIDALAAAGGAVEPLPNQPDPPPPMDLTDLFTIATREPATPIREVVKLPHPEKMNFGPGGDGPTDLVGPIGVPRAIDLDRVPRAVVQPSPDYPYSLKQEGLGGSVTVEFLVGTDGRVLSAEAVKWTRRRICRPGGQGPCCAGGSNPGR